MLAYSTQGRILTGEPDAPLRIAFDFAAQLATNVWLGRLTEDAARAVLHAYAMACHRTKSAQAELEAALRHEYLLCRERLDLCS